MELGALIRLLWRQKLWTGPASVIAVLVIGWAAVAAPPGYRAGGTLVLMTATPTAAPPVVTTAAVAPADGVATTEAPQPAPAPPAANPFAPSADVSVVVDALQRIMRSAPVGEAIRARGFVGDYKVDATFYYLGPVVDIAADGADPQTATSNLEILFDEVQAQLAQLQIGAQVAPSQLVRSEIVVAPSDAGATLPSRVRRVGAVGILAGGFVLSMALIGQWTQRLRRQRRHDARARTAAPVDDTRLRAVRPLS